MTVNFFSETGSIDLSLIDEAEVALLSAPQKDALNIFIAAAIAKTQTEIDHRDARALVYACMKDEDEKFRLHQIANPAPTQLEALRANQAQYRADHS